MTLERGGEREYSQEQAAADMARQAQEFGRKTGSVENQGIKGSTDNAGREKKELTEIAKGKDRYAEDDFLKELAVEKTPEAQAIFNILITFDSRRIQSLSAFLEKKGATLFSIRIVEDQDRLQELLKKYGAEADDGNLKAIEAQIGEIPDL